MGLSEAKMFPHRDQRKTMSSVSSLGGRGRSLQRLSFGDLAGGRSELLFIGTPVPRFVPLG